MKLKTAFKFTSFVVPACMPPPNLTFGKSTVNCVVSGWGDTTNGRGRFAENLGGAVVQFYPPQECNRFHKLSYGYVFHKKTLKKKTLFW